MQEEIQELEANNTWEVTSLPPGKTPIGYQWFFKTKINPNDIVNRYKTRLVAKGYNHVKGVDYFDSFSPMVKSVIVLMFLSVTTACSWPTHQLNVNNVFLPTFLDEEVDMLSPTGYIGAKSRDVSLLRKSLYGLKQWNVKHSSKLYSSSFQQSVVYLCLFFKRTSTSFLTLIIFMDNVPAPLNTILSS